MSHAIYSLQCTSNKTAMNQDAIAHTIISQSPETNYSLERMQFYMSLSSLFLNELIRLNLPAPKAGAAFAACLIKPGRYYVTAHIGDCRVYSLSKLASGWWVRQLTFDHDRAHDHRPELKWSRTRPERLKSVGLNMSRALGNWEAEISGLSHKADVSGSHYKEGETRYLVCSDGLSDAWTSAELEKYLNEHMPVRGISAGASSSKESHADTSWQEIVIALTRKAKEIWLTKIDHSDDISVLVTDITDKVPLASTINEAELLLVADGHGDGGEFFAGYAVKFFPIILRLLLQYPYERIPYFNWTDLELKLYQYFESLPKDSLNFNNADFEKNLERFVLPFLELLINQEWLSGTEDGLKLSLARLNSIAVPLNAAELDIVMHTLMQTYVKNNHYFINTFASSADSCNFFNKEFYMASSYFYTDLVRPTEDVAYDFELITQLQLWLMFEIANSDHVNQNKDRISAAILARTYEIFTSDFKVAALETKLRPLYQRGVLYHQILELLERRRFDGFRERLLYEWQTALVTAFPASRGILFAEYHAPHLFKLPTLGHLLEFLLSKEADGLLNLPVANYKDFDGLLDSLLRDKIPEYASMEAAVAKELRREIIQFRKWILVKDFFDYWDADAESSLKSASANALNKIYIKRICIFDSALIDQLINLIPTIIKELTVARNLYSTFVLDLSLPDEPESAMVTASTSLLWHSDSSLSSSEDADDEYSEGSYSDSGYSATSAAGGAGKR